MRSVTLMLGAIYFWYVAANINKKHEKGNFFRGVFVLLSWVSFVASIILTCIGV